MKHFLDQKVELYQQPHFIISDPIQVPHRFTKKEDIEIAGFIAATLAWGQRPMIIKKSIQIIQLMNNSPYEFLINSSELEYQKFQKFVYRTFNEDDLLFLISSLRNLYMNEGGLEFCLSQHPDNMSDNIDYFRSKLFQSAHLIRSEKHIANPKKGSAAKRINMFLRWMVRSDEKGVDFGIWKSINPAQLMIPLDTHSGRIARKFNLLKRTSNDWQSVQELTERLREFDSTDPIKYDFALFGIGAFENKI